VTSVFFTYPLDLLRVRLAYETKLADQRVSLRKTFHLIYNEKAPSSTPGTGKTILERFPLAKFYRGYIVSIIGVVPYAGVSFLLWGRLQNGIRKTTLLSAQDKRRYRTLLDLGCGAIAGALSQTASYPFEVIRRRMQVGGLLQPGRLVGFGETVRLIYRTSGYRGFFIGLAIGYVKIVPMSALSFATWKAWYVSCVAIA
jgi:solute carrier family 25 protein 16